MFPYLCFLTILFSVSSALAALGIGAVMVYKASLPFIALITHLSQVSSINTSSASELLSDGRRID